MTDDRRGSHFDHNPGQVKGSKGTLMTEKICKCPRCLREFSWQLHGEICGHCEIDKAEEIQRRAMRAWLRLPVHSDTDLPQ